MTRRILAFVLAVLLCFGLFGCASKPNDRQETPDQGSSTQQEQQKDTSQDGEEDAKEEEAGQDPATTSSITPILYKVTDDQDHVVWLFGSIHVGTEDFYPLPEYVIDAFENSDALAVELDLISFERNFLKQISAVRTLLCPSGTTVADYIDPQLYQAAVDILKENGVYQQAFDMYLPVMWMSLIQSLTIEDVSMSAQYGVDLHLLEQARKAKMEILEVESAKEQYTMLASFSAPLQELLLEQAVVEYLEPALGQNTQFLLLQYWKQGREKLLRMLLSTQDLPEDDPQYDLWQEYSTAMITDRDEKMSQYARDALASGEEVFICVGAAHVVGKGAMVDTLKADGYTVERIGPEK